MSIFNQFRTSVWEPTTTNQAGGPAYEVNPKWELASILLTSFVKDKFYRSKEVELGRLSTLMNDVDHKFAAKAAIYARNEFGMRSISHIVAGEIGRRVKGADWTKRFFSKISRRPDDMLEILAFYLNLISMKKARKIPNAMKNGFRDAFTRFDEYQIAKYRKEDREITLVDLVNLVHPKYNDALTKLMKGELKSEHTFEAKISGAGQKAKSAESEEEKLEIKAEAWGDLLTSKRIGYMALLKNLRNIVQQAPNYLPLAIEMLTDPRLIKKSLVLPFRYATALEELQQIQHPLNRLLIPALMDAADIALDNVPKLPGRTLIALDKSGSMRAQLNIASQFAACLYKANDAALMIFDDTAGYLQPNPREQTLSLQRTILYNCSNMGGTNFNSVFVRAKEKYDRIIFISDEQHWVGGSSPAVGYKSYCRHWGTRPSIFMIDTAGLGSLAFPEEKVYAIAGFSEKIFDLMAMLEEDRNILINKIEAVEI